MKKREFDIFGLLLGIVIGCILGFFLSTRIDLERLPAEGQPVGVEKGNIHLLLVNKLNNAEETRNLLSELQAKGYYAVDVYSGGYYYIFGGIALKREDLSSLATKYNDDGYTDTVIIKEYILDLPNAVVHNQEAFDFWSYSIEILLKSLNNEDFVVDQKYVTGKPLHTEMSYHLLIMMNYQDVQTLNQARLNSYEIIVENLG
jgi:hypothetical protein